MTQVIRINRLKPSLELINQAVEVVRAGGVIAYPTETFYGLGVNALNQRAIKKIYSIKKRSFSQPLLILIPDRDVLSQYVKDIPEIALKLTDKFWPGPLTLIFSASPDLPPILCAQTQKIAIRVSSHPIARALVKAFNLPITSTSANISGYSSPTTPYEVSLHLKGKVDLIIDGGKTRGGKPSTIIDVTQFPPRLIREGVISFQELRSYWSLAE